MTFIKKMNPVFLVKVKKSRMSFVRTMHMETEQLSARKELMLTVRKHVIDVWKSPCSLFYAKENKAAKSWAIFR